MSRLDSFIRRLSAQRDCLNACAEVVRKLPGVILEIGLGNGRTYDHLRALFPGRDIYAFDRHIAAHPDCIPPEAHCFIGELEDTLPRAAEQLAGRVVLAHIDIGSGKPDVDRGVAELIGSHLGVLLSRGALVVADQRLSAPYLTPERLPAGVAHERYFIYRT